MASSLPATEIEARLREFYDEHNPGNQQNIAEIVHKYRGKENVLCAKLQKKYGVAPDLVRRPNVGKATNTTNSGSLDVPKPSAPIVYDPEYKIIKVTNAQTTVKDPMLDFCAPTFDALRALQVRDLVPPVQGLAPLDNIYKCRHLLPAADPNHQKAIITTAKKPTKEMTLTTPSTKPSEPMPLLFETLADTYLDGPFTLLRRCFLERTRVCVVVRRVNSVRGTLRGFLKAFDKHMNLVLLDVQQQWIPPSHYAVHDRTKRLMRVDAKQPQDAPPLLSVADERRNRPFTTTSYAKQLFVRGDNVVMVFHDDRSTTTTTNTSRRDCAPAAHRR